MRAIYPGNVLGGSPLYQGFTLGEVLYITNTGTFEKADYPGLRALRVFAQGSGGAAGGAPATGAGQISAGLPGGAGSCAISLVLATDLDESEAVTIGDGGVGTSGSNGGAGNSTTFDTISGSVVGTGGGGGSFIAAGNTDAAQVAGFAGQTGTGDFVIGGEAGQPMWRLLSTACVAGSGGKSHLGCGGNRVGSNTAPNPGTNGGGGGGCVNGASQSARTGAAGGKGIVIVELLY